MLGSGDVFIAGSEYFFDAGNRFCAVSESGDGLRAADTGDFADAQKICGGEKLMVGLGADGDDARNVCNLRGDGSHE